MTGVKKLTDERNFYLERFTRFEYAAAFEKLKNELALLLDNAGEEGTDETVSEFMECASQQSKGLFRKNIEIDRFCRFYALYVVPAAMESGFEKFGSALREEWNRTYPKNTFAVGNYQEIVSGFRTKPFGMG